ncbi:DUF1236 domain-containing protein [Methylobacterium dankookense]|uniref:DUF1236 domain-containing protein n=1 Tax=Methylobacterium dankookense TaxID=560405 RepID=A0A564FT52_9HYPH|nr:DUF1236 domain-containing protein [Methylobacterium dankookense]GJD56585.1 hypothetical protein IFDJLNFL_2482 [Methylobacterium dankookense]VUF10946.1 hypothetical protein MTDSW087_00618 [Methylobacterium dankookense]
MTNKLLLTLATAAALALPAAAQAQGTLRGAAEGAEVGADAAGPIGGIVGGAVGAATGTVGGILGIDDRPRFRTYVRERNVNSYRWGGPVRVGTVLPDDGVTYYDVPTEYRVRPGYRYTIVNEQPVLVDRGHRIVEIVD